MYCPSCGQQQISGDLKFCNKCGLPMGLVAEVLRNGGVLPQLEELASNNKGFFRGLLTRKNGIFFSILWFILFVPFGASFWGVLGVDELSAISAVFGVFSSLVLFLFSLFFLESAPAKELSDHTYAENSDVQPHLGGVQQNQGALPPQHAQTAQEYVSPQAGMWKAPDTGDLASPGSVTEGTTRLLQKEDE